MNPAAWRTKAPPLRSLSECDLCRTMHAPPKDARGHRRPRKVQSRRIERPAYSAVSPSISSMRINWLYFASRSERASDPVLI